MSVCAKIIYSWVRKVLDTAKAHTSLGTFQGAAMLAAFVALVSLVFILQAGHYQSFYPGQTLHFNMYHYYKSAPGSHTAGCPWPQ